MSVIGHAVSKLILLKDLKKKPATKEKNLTTIKSGKVSKKTPSQPKTTKKMHIIEPDSDNEIEYQFVDYDTELVPLKTKKARKVKSTKKSTSKSLKKNKK